MKGNDNQTELRDDDIRALLDARAPQTSPADLDARILAAAQAASSTDATPAGRSAEEGSKTRRSGRWLAAAAVIALSVILVPVLQQQSLVDPTATSSFNDSPTPLLENRSVQADVTTRLEQPSGSSVTGRSQAEPASNTHSTAEKAEKSPVVKLLRQREIATVEQEFAAPANRIAPQSAEESAPGDSLASMAVGREARNMTPAEIIKTYTDFPYRRSLQTWQAEIKRLENAGLTRQVVHETVLFERMHPELSTETSPAEQGGRQ